MERACPTRFTSGCAAFFGASAGRQAWNLAWFSVAGSNIFSNVPFVLVAGKWIHNFAHPELMWKVMALATTFAGNLTILGSVANIIVVESARGQMRSGFLGLCAFRHSDHAVDDRGRAGDAVAAARMNQWAAFAGLPEN